MIREFFTYVGALALALLAAAATPARAAGPTVVVDDDLQCPSATFSRLQDAIDFIGTGPGTINVCPGLYLGELHVVNANGLKIVGKPGAVIAPSFATSPRFTGVLLKVERSTNVTVQGLTFDGVGALQTFGDPNAIEYADSTGTIQKNTVTNWHRPSFQPADVVNGNRVGLLHAIHAIRFPTTPGGQHLPVTIANNTITQYQEHAIDAEGDLQVTISGNKITAGLHVDDPNIFTQAITLQPAGITSATSPTGTIKRNVMTGHGGSGASSAIDSGILMRQTGFVTVAGNKIDHIVIGVNVFANCLSPASSNNNTIRSNKMTEVTAGIDVTALGGFPGAVCEPHVDNYLITGNKIVNDQTDPLNFGLTGIQFDIRTVGAAPAFALNEIVRGNTVIDFLGPLDAPQQTGGTITGVFAPNRLVAAEA
ncbi:MAG TPA: right-handed parallel beta-helix repeat-containing protein [Candidatus Binatia bacterium]|nr:right-handed parallel beta-helix repeat-containing protein [Candidatus Binatia bacterium]